MTGEQRAMRDEARVRILQTVNRFCLAFRRANAARSWRALPPARLYGSRHIQQAVFVALQRKLVDAETLRLAGFNPRGGTP